MDNKDLKQIREIFKEEFDAGFDRKFKPAFDSAFKPAFDSAFKPAFQEVFSEVWEGNLEPAFNSVYERFDQTDHDLKAIENKLDRALYTEMVKLEVRVTRLEERTGIKKK